MGKECQTAAVTPCTNPQQGQPLLCMPLLSCALSASRRCLLPGARRCFSHQPPSFSLGYVFDIDGVLLRGNVPLEGARASLKSLLAARVPFIFLTNGGGELESSKAAKLSKLLDLPVHPAQVVLSHTPMKPLCQQLGSARVLVLGCRDVLGVARSYGLTTVDTPMCLLKDEPSRYPFIQVEQRRALAHRDEPFAAVLVLHDPNSWGLELQVVLDVLRGGVPLGSGMQQSVPYIASNADLTFAGAHSVPRLAGGAFTTALHAMWAATHPGGGPLTTRFFGKPCVSSLPPCADSSPLTVAHTPQASILYSLPPPVQHKRNV